MLRVVNLIYNLFYCFNNCLCIFFNFFLFLLTLITVFIPENESESRFSFLLFPNSITFWRWHDSVFNQMSASLFLPLSLSLSLWVSFYPPATAVIPSLIVTSMCDVYLVIVTISKYLVIEKWDFVNMVTNNFFLFCSLSCHSTMAVMTWTNDLNCFELKHFIIGIIQLKSAGKETSIRGFQDPVIATATPVIDLIDAIKPGSINYSAVLPGSTDEVFIAFFSSSLSTSFLNQWFLITL